MTSRWRVRLPRIRWTAPSATATDHSKHSQQPQIRHHSQRVTARRARGRQRPPVTQFPNTYFLPTVHNGPTVNRPGQAFLRCRFFCCTAVRDLFAQLSANNVNSDPRKGHASPATTRVYLHADMALKEQALTSSTVAVSR